MEKLNEMMKKQKNEIYAKVNEEYLSKFNYNHLVFMKDYYYKFYFKFCQHYQRKPLSQEEFFSNMHRRRIQLFQLCCPYCGSIYLIPVDKKIHGSEGFNYCSHCGRSSAIENITKQIFRFIRINRINRLGLIELKEKRSEVEEWLLAYDCYQMEIIELASIIEVVFRDYFEALLFINNLGESNRYNSYIEKIVKKHTGNDFMNIEKANNNYKKAFDINIRELLDKQIWNDLIDIVNLRNMMAHNNGMVDEHFKSTPTYTRLNDRIIGQLFRLEDSDIAKYLNSVIIATTEITNAYLEKYYVQRNATVANYYFNNTEINFEELSKTD